MYTQVAANKRKTVYLMLAFIILLSVLGWVFAQAYGTPVITIFVLGFALTYSLISYFASSKIALALTGATEVSKKEAPELYRTVENLAITAGLPTPKVYIIQDAAPNAFATGRDPEHAVVAVTTGLLEILNEQELEGVLAHELSHIGNYDIRVMAIVIMLVTVIGLVSDFFLRMTFWGGDRDRGGNAFAILGLVAAIVAPFVAMLLRLAVSRKREFLADASGALLTRYPEGLASALNKIAGSKQEMKHANSATAHLFISNPLKQRKKPGAFARLFSTHPPTEERVEALQKMETKL
ncbi:MAG: M48 family metalloprotease [Candidatus Saccharimonadales bacterium]